MNANPSVKVTLLGDVCSGKTSLFHRFINDRFDGVYTATVVNLCGRKDVMSRTSIVTLNVCDIAFRNKVYTAMHSPEDQAAIVCFDLTERESFKVAKFWVESLKNNQQECKIYLCGTKKDLVDDKKKPRALSPYMIARYMREIQAPYMETSSKTGENIDALFQNIADDFVQKDAEECEAPINPQSSSSRKNS